MGLSDESRHTRETGERLPQMIAQQRERVFLYGYPGVSSAGVLVRMPSMDLRETFDVPMRAILHTCHGGIFRHRYGGWYVCDACGCWMRWTDIPKE
jgi:hypothetical protein